MTIHPLAGAAGGDHNQDGQFPLSPLMMPRTVFRVPLSYLPLVFIGWLDHYTGREMHMGSLYLLAVAIAAWNLCARALIIYTCAAVAVWCTSEWYQGIHYSTTALVCWNFANRVGVVSITAITVFRAKLTHEHQQRLIRELGQTLLKVSRFKELVPVCRLCHEIHLDDEYRARFKDIVSEGADESTIGDVCPTCRAALTRRVDHIPVASYFQSDAA